MLVLKTVEVPHFFLSFLDPDLIIWISYARNGLSCLFIPQLSVYRFISRRIPNSVIFLVWSAVIHLEAKIEIIWYSPRYASRCPLSR